jgi:hypothetical protein
VADGNGAGEGGSAIGRASGERAGLGLLSRFLGAVFLVLLGGLLLLDRALLHANENQARLDAQSAALLAEAFMSAQSELLDRVAGIAAHEIRGSDSAAVHASVRHMVAVNGAVRHVWAVDSAGRLLLDIDGPGGAAALSPAFRAGLHLTRASDHTMIAVLRSGWRGPPLATRPRLAGYRAEQQGSSSTPGRSSGSSLEWRRIRALPL